MRGLRSTFLLLLVLIGLVGYIYFVDRNRPVGETETLEKAFTDVTADDIEEIEIRSETGDTSRLQKTDGAWKIVSPVEADTDEGELSTITTSLADIQIQRIVEDQPADLKRFGLDPPRIEIGFREKGEKELSRLLLGDKSPTGSEIYARTPDSPRVFLIGGFLEGTFNKDTFALRNKNILKFERDKVDTLELTRGSTNQVFSKDGTEWRIVKPISARGDFGMIAGIVERLGSAQLQSIVEPEAKDLRKYGLDRPSATIAVGSGSSRATLLLGRTENAVVFAKDTSRPMVFTVAPTLETDVFKELAELRRKDLFDARAFTAERVELQRGSETFTFEKAKGDDEAEVWRAVGGKEIESEKIQDLLGRLTALRADSFESSAGRGEPLLTATVRFDGNRMETVAFRRAGDQVLASRTDEPGAAVLAATALDDVIKALDAAQ